MILMEDIAETRGATFVEPLTPLTSAQIDDVVVSLASCHGALWDAPDLRGMNTTRDHLANVSGFAAMGSCSVRGIAKAGDLVSPGVRGQAERLWAGTIGQLTMLTTEHTPTLLHGDNHVGQVYLTRDGRAGLTDWPPGLVIAFARSPMTLALCAHDLQRSSDGRLLLGLGSQVEAHITRRFSMPRSEPAARMREYVLALRAIWATSNDAGFRPGAQDALRRCATWVTLNTVTLDCGSRRVEIRAAMWVTMPRR
jgi:hypothetical protein